MAQTLNSSLLKNSQVSQEFLEKEFLDPDKDKVMRHHFEHSFYGFLSGQVKNPQQCNKYKIDNPDSERLLETAYFKFSDAAHCFKEKSMDIFMGKDYTSKELENAIQQYTTQYTKEGSEYFETYKATAVKKQQLFADSYNTDNSDSYGCCLALSYYTGVYYQRINRNSNIIMKLDMRDSNFVNDSTKEKVKLKQTKLGASLSTSKVEESPKFQYMKCISYWLFKALHYIPLHWGIVTRCIDLQPAEEQIYKTGNIVTWIQFSSSSYGPTTDYFKNKNTRFIIYSLSGRCIEQFSNYGNQSEVLFKPFSHFLILSKQKSDGKLMIHMREIFFGQSTHNVLWVDDNIFDKEWQNKKLIEQALLHQPLLNIIPKVSTETAIAFLKSQLCKQRKPEQFRILTDMTRENEVPPNNAGARFIRMALPICKNLKYLIFVYNKSRAEKCLQEQKIPKNSSVEITNLSSRALKFLIFQ